MPNVRDTGKIWIPGKMSPEFAVRVDDRVFAPGKNAEQEIDYWLEGNFLCIDLHESGKRRIARRFNLDLDPTVKATLFSGFENTHHGDVHVVTHQSPGVDECVLEGEHYRNEGAENMSSREFWKRADFGN
ncbi:MAG: hypothetical protein ACE5EK_09700 [Nitrospinales bacterium]